MDIHGGENGPGQAPDEYLEDPRWVPRDAFPSCVWHNNMDNLHVQVSCILTHV